MSLGFYGVYVLRYESVCGLYHKKPTFQLKRYFSAYIDITVLEFGPWPLVVFNQRQNTLIEEKVELPAPENLPAKGISCVSL
jgi:hypothetical protein